MHFTGRGILLDIEGTTSSISFVVDVMFAFVRRELDAYLLREWGTPELHAAVEQLARDKGLTVDEAFGAEEPSDERRTEISTEVLRLMDGDVKSTGLKQLQGLIWKEGFHRGELRADIFADVPPALERWTQAGIDVRIYSSGSVQAQQLFFGHTTAGDLLPFFRGHYDTRIGGKKESASYTAIAREIGLPPNEILFVSDIVAELDAARSAGMQTALAMRPGNAVPPAGHGHPEVSDFRQIELAS